MGLGGMLFLFGLQPKDDNVHIVGSPLYHTAVLVFSGGALHIGHTLVVMDKWTPEGMLERIERYRVTNSHMVPTQFHRLLALPDEVKGRYDVSSLRHMVHAAAPCPPEIKRRMIEWWGPVIDEYYAASEGGGTIVFPDEWLKKPGTVGKPWPISEIVILDDEGNPVREGEIGTVYMYMQTGNFEYFKDKEKTDKSRRGKYFTVGDVGYLDGDGFAHLMGRIDGVINRGGEKVYPRHVEEVLRRHPGVADAAVVGEPDPMLGERPVAFVVARSAPEGTLRPRIQAEPTDLQAELRALCERELTRHQRPDRILITDSLPSTPTGKVRRDALRALAPP